MMNGRFDPYDMLIELNNRLQRLEIAHNKMANAFQKTEVDLNVTLHSLRTLQQKHIQLSQKVHQLETELTNQQVLK